MTNIMIIGAGITGAFLAYDLTRYDDLRITLVDRHQDVGEEVSNANSAIIHAGYDPKEHTLKAALNKRGSDRYPEICAKLHVDYQKCGGYVLACGKEEEATLQALYAQGLRRHVRMKWQDRMALLQQEPNLSDEVSAGLWVPDTAIITPWEVCEALIEEAMLNGLILRMKENVLNIEAMREGYVVTTDKASYPMDIVINAAGLGAQRIMEMIEKEPLFTITPKRGQYYVLSKKAGKLVSHVLYPTPSKAGKGVLAVPTVHGNILLGPTSEPLCEADTATTAQGLRDVREKLKKTVTNIPYQEVIHCYSGCRPTGNHGDFYIKESTAHPGILHLGCIDSPGLACAPAISEYVIETFLKPKMTLRQKQTWHHRQAPQVMAKLSEQQKQEQIRKTPAYGHIVCYCEKISEQEVVNCIHKPCGARSIRGVKKRIRPGMGKCQGGYCEAEIAHILARELHIPLCEVCYDEDSYYKQGKGAGK